MIYDSYHLFIVQDHKPKAYFAYTFEKYDPNSCCSCRGCGKENVKVALINYLGIDLMNTETRHHRLGILTHISQGNISTNCVRNDAIPAIDHDLFDSVNKSAIQLTTELVTELVMLFMQE